jgi:hypothetical protein
MALSYGDIAARALMQAFHRRDYSFGQYKNALMTSYLGQDIKAYSQLAQRLYSGKENPLSAIRDFLTDRMIRLKLRALLSNIKNTE